MKKKSRKIVVQEILGEFLKNGFSFPSMERVLQIKQKTLTKWHKGEEMPPPEAVPLLKIIRLFPWLLCVADCNFDPRISKMFNDIVEDAKKKDKEKKS